MWIVKRGLRVTGYGLRVTGYGLRVTGYGLRVTGYGLRVTGYGLRVTGYGLRVTGYGLRVTGYGLRLRVTGYGENSWAEPVVDHGEREGGLVNFFAAGDRAEFGAMSTYLPASFSPRQA